MITCGWSVFTLVRSFLLFYSSHMSYTFTAVYQKQGNWYLGWIEEIPGVNTQGKTLKEAKENLKEALELVLAVNMNTSSLPAC